MKRKTILILLSVLYSAIGYSEEKAIPLNISIFNEATAIPFTRFITTPLHPGIQVGTEFNYRTKSKTRIFQTLNLSYFYHNYLAQGIGFLPELGYEVSIKKKFTFSTLIGLGYQHTFATAEEYTFTNGHYEKKADKGNARLYPSLSFEIGYLIFKENDRSPKVFIRYQSWIEYPYSPDFIPAMTHINLHLGAKFFILKK